MLKRKTKYILTCADCILHYDHVLISTFWSTNVVRYSTCGTQYWYKVDVLDYDCKVYIGL